MDSIVSHILLLSIILVFSPYIARLFRLQKAHRDYNLGSYSLKNYSWGLIWEPGKVGREA